MTIFQLTTSHGGRLIVSQRWRRNSNLSTHDLTRRSTRKFRLCLLNFCLSTHDLTRRSTWMESPFLYMSSSFNSRPHTEVDSFRTRILCEQFLFQLTTSHGGRLYSFLLRRRNTPFNSRHHTEVDLLTCASFRLYSVFQLTTSHGGRLDSQICFSIVSPFNSRPHTEVDFFPPSF